MTKQDLLAKLARERELLDAKIRYVETLDDNLEPLEPYNAPERVVNGTLVELPRESE